MTNGNISAGCSVRRERLECPKIVKKTLIVLLDGGLTVHPRINL